MLHYGGPTPKRHYAFSNCRHVANLNAGKLRGWARVKKALKQDGKLQSLVDHYVDKQGKKRWKGNKSLRASESGTHFVETQTILTELIGIYHNRFFCAFNGGNHWENLVSEVLGLNFPTKANCFVCNTFWHLTWETFAFLLVGFLGTILQNLVPSWFHYLRSSVHLRVPEEFAGLLPRKL